MALAEIAKIAKIAKIEATLLIAGIDVHKKLLAVAVADVAVAGDFRFERLKVGTSPASCARLLTGSSSARSTKS